MNDLLITEKALYAIVGHQIVKYTFGAPMLTQQKNKIKDILASIRGKIENL